MSLAAVFRAVQECRAKPPGDPQRIIVVLAPSGFGLPLLYCELLRRRGAVFVPAGQLDQKRLGFLKLLAHRTRLVPLLLASAAAWRRWTRRRTLEAALIRRRTHLVVELDAPSSDNTECSVSMKPLHAPPSLPSPRKTGRGWPQAGRGVGRKAVTATAH